MKSILRSKLEIFFQHIFYAARAANDSLDMAETMWNPSGLEKLREAFSLIDQIDKMVQGWLRDNATHAKGALEALSPLAAQIGKHHLHLWTGIVQNISEMAESKKEDDLHRAVYLFLENTRTFNFLGIEE